MTNKPRVALGDLFEIRTRRGLAYAQLSHEHSEAGRILRVLPGFFPSRPPDLDAIVAGETAWFAQLNPVYALAQGTFSGIVGRYQIPEHAQEFPGFKDAERDPRTGAIKGWEVWKGGRVRFRRKLNAEQHGYSPDGQMSDEFFLTLLEYGFRAGDDLDALDRAQSEDQTGAGTRDGVDPKSDLPGRVEHFLYFDSAETARRAVARLLEDGIAAELGIDHDGEYSAYAYSDHADLSTADRIAELAEELGGEYDGYGEATA